MKPLLSFWGARDMRILMLIHGFNSLSQRMFVELLAAGHEVTIEFDINDDQTREAVTVFSPDVIISPYLKREIPADIWQNHLCLVVHPGVIGDRGPSAMDWAILRSDDHWGVTVLQAEAEMDAGPIWDAQNFAMRGATKSSLYRTEVADMALKSVFRALEKLHLGEAPRPLSYDAPNVTGQLRPAVLQKDRCIDWSNDTTAQILTKIRASDGVPGVLDSGVYLHDAHVADLPATLHGAAGDIIAKSGPAICRATTDGAVWIGHMRDPTGQHTFKLPSTDLVSPEVPEIPLDSPNGYREIEYRQDRDVGYLRFNFYNGAMSTAQCKRLLGAYLDACKQPTKVIVLEGGDDFWSNGIHLNIIEAAKSAADESWENINAMNDLSEAIIRTTSHLTVAAMRGNAGAGGVFLARACDQIWLHSCVVLNPHYKDMGNLYGSEFWTYLLPRYCGTDNAKRIAQQRLPMRAAEAVSFGLADVCLTTDRKDFNSEVAARATALCSAGFDEMLAGKQRRRIADEVEKPLAEYRTQELVKMKRNFYGFDPSYHVARYNFVHKICKSRTPITLARHRDKAYDKCTAEHDRPGHDRIAS